MSGIGWPVVLALMCWGTVAALDLVSVPQALLSRPLVVGIVTGLLLGDAEAGLRSGAVLELFALDVLPVGAVRYPDYGPATVAAVAAGAGAPWELSLGVSVTLGLLLAAIGGWALQWLRHANARAIQRVSAALAAGDARAIRKLQFGGIARDLMRGALLTALGLAVASLVAARVEPDRTTALALTLAAVGSAIAAAAGGALRSAGLGDRLRMVGAGLAVGTVLAWLR
jgi:mannose/fructose/N-acetylgalactosamine-specific phosphotransferase system component IIC